MEELNMTARELMEWGAYEQVYGSLLPHERIDIGFAQVCYYLVMLLSQKKRVVFEEFLPKWMRDLRRRSTPQITDPKKIEAMFKALASMGGRPSQP